MTDEIENVGKIADATKEVAKTGGKAIDALSDTGHFFNSVFGDLIIDGVGLVRDRLKFYRYERAELLASKVQKQLKENGITNLRVVAPKIALPLIEAATIEDDDYLHTLWANLLMTSMDSEAKLTRMKYVSILRTLDLEDAKLLEFVFNFHVENKRTGIIIKTLIDMKFPTTSIEYLLSHGLLASERIPYPDNDYVESSNPTLRMTKLAAIDFKEYEGLNLPKFDSSTKLLIDKSLTVTRDFDVIVPTELAISFCESVFIK